MIYRLRRARCCRWCARTRSSGGRVSTVAMRWGSSPFLTSNEFVHISFVWFYFFNLIFSKIKNVEFNVTYIQKYVVAKLSNAFHAFGHTLGIECLYKKQCCKLTT